MKQQQFIARRLDLDAIRLSRCDDVPPEEYASRRGRLDVRLRELIDGAWECSQAKRLVKRMRRHQGIY